MKAQYGIILAFIVCIGISSISSVSAQSELDIDAQRAADLEKFESGIPDQDNLREIAANTFAKPIADQSEDVLLLLAKQSNYYANLIGFITDEYKDYHNSKYRFDFVTEKVAIPMDAYAGIENEFKTIRNQAYFNLGLKAEAAGRGIEALLLFRDAHKLSAFDCFETRRENCMRWKAEQEMQKLLGLSHIRAYVTWKE